MNVKNHFFLGILFSLLSYFIFSQIGFLEAFLIFFGSFFIDVDVWLLHLFKTGSLSISKAYKWAWKRKSKYLKLSRKQRNKIAPLIRIFHNFETLVIIFLLGYLISTYFYFLLIGMFFHLILDWIDQAKYHDKIYKVSLISDYLKAKKLKML